jgi:hypothetical protein
MQIDESDEQPENAECSMLDNLQPASNVTVESPVHSLKHL